MVSPINANTLRDTSSNELSKLVPVVENKILAKLSEESQKGNFLCFLCITYIINDTSRKVLDASAQWFVAKSVIKKLEEGGFNVQIESSHDFPIWATISWNDSPEEPVKTPWYKKLFRITKRKV